MCLKGEIGRDFEEDAPYLVRQARIARTQRGRAAGYAALPLYGTSVLGYILSLPPASQVR
jgi:hypothetical protein